MSESEDKDLADPGFGPADFHSQVFGGQLRWFASGLTVASGGLLAYLMKEGENARLDVPIHLEGREAQALVAFALLVWGILAIANWRNRLKKKRAGLKAP